MSIGTTGFFSRVIVTHQLEHYMFLYLTNILYLYFVCLVMLSQVNSHIGGVNLDGRLVNLRFTEDCATNINSENLCLLFKLRGSFTCEFKSH